MCGIAGIIGANADAGRVEKMVAAMSRRGPDDCGVWGGGEAGAALGHARLSIIDLSSAGHQPMSTRDGRYWMVFNGEIYNYLEIRKGLELDGHNFFSNSDSEVVLAAFRKWGQSCLQSLRGMFAFAIWDTSSRSLFLARDRMGIKPLVWAETAGGFLFASGINAMLASGLLARTVDPESLFDLLATGSVCQPKTIIKGVESLGPGTCMRVTEGGVRTVTRYWNPNSAIAALRPELQQLSYSELVSLTSKKLEDACRAHLIADVQVGSFLSGGIDSTSVTALMSRNMTKPVKSFSLGFECTHEMENELDAAKLAAQHIGCDHTEIILRGEDVAESFSDLIRMIDQPSYDGTNTYFVSKAASQQVKVALSGLGGDELFAGYPHFSLLESASLRRKNIFDAVLSSINSLRPNRWTYPAAIRCMSTVQRYASLRRILSDDDIFLGISTSLESNFKPGFIEAFVSPLLDRSLDSISTTCLFECNHYLVNTLLRDADAMSMAHSLEVRPVMLDHILVEHALALPSEVKVRNGEHKAILVDAVRDLLPAGLLSRPKTGFTLPLGTWLKTTLRQRLVASLNSPLARSLFQIDFLNKRLQGIDDATESRLLWMIFILVSWAEEHRCTFTD